jgi:hypothetical protein
MSGIGSLQWYLDQHTAPPGAAYVQVGVHRVLIQAPEAITEIISGGGDGWRTVPKWRSLITQEIIDVEELGDVQAANETQAATTGTPKDAWVMIVRHSNGDMVTLNANSWLLLEAARKVGGTIGVQWLDSDAAYAAATA